ncbi:MAG: type I restriction enzyme HsdR N-terminal domain-containing protein [Simkaniaceae bacterium]|nr:type I restriction enzyme HsdR N-terminal domain-containing protein [Simkaniaceae bacterium]
MGSSLPSRRRDGIFDPVRKKKVVATPEEIVRQEWIARLRSTLRFPPEAISVERGLFSPKLPMVRVDRSSRRFDLLCFHLRKGIPLLLIECKAIPLQERMFSQLWGYNARVRAPFVALVNDKEVRMSWESTTGRRMIDYIPVYEELCRCF